MLRLAVVAAAAVLGWWGAQPGTRAPSDPGVGTADTDGFSPRFPSTPPASPPDAGAAPPPSSGLPSPEVCNAVAPELRFSCPLRGRVTRIERRPEGVRLWVRDRGLPADRLEAALRCQLGLAAVKRDLPPPCTFLVPAPELAVGRAGKGLVSVDLVWQGADAGTLGRRRELVETGLGLRTSNGKQR